MSEELMLKGKCPFCGNIFEYPYSDRVDVVLFNNWRKFHYCDQAKEHDAINKKKQTDLVSDWGFPDVPKDLKMVGEKDK